MSLYKNIIFPWCYDKVLKCPSLDIKRQEVVSKASGQVLEIGIGTGQNLPFYPGAISEISAIDPNPGMHQQLEKKLLESKVKVNAQVSPCEHLPFADCTFDTVVSTLVLCSVNDIQKSLGEIHRVLKSGGKFIFFEHGLSPAKSTAKWQQRLTPLWSKVGDGCRLNVNMEEEISQSALKIKELDKFYLNQAPKFISFVYSGIAIKPEI